MFDIKTIASGSKGNAYVVSDGQTTLLMECGVPWSMIQIAMRFKTSAIDGALITHGHGDHCCSAMKVANAGIDIFTTRGTAKEAGILGHHRLNIVKNLHTFIAGPSIIVMPFRVVHDTSEPVGFVLRHTGDGPHDQLLFMTDTAYCEWRFTGITHLMIECNFSEDIILSRPPRDAAERARYERIVRNHMSVSRVKDFIFDNKMQETLKGVWLMHLSSENSDEERFLDEIRRATGVPVYAC